MERHVRQMALWLPVIAYAALIWWLSSRPMPEELPGIPFIDKILHIGLYAGFGVLTCRAIDLTRDAAGRWRSLLLSVLLCTLYGLSDEWHQSVIPTRMADPFDVLADCGGALVGAISWLRWRHLVPLWGLRGGWIDKHRSLS